MSSNTTTDTFLLSIASNRSSVTHRRAVSVEWSLPLPLWLLPTSSFWLGNPQAVDEQNVKILSIAWVEERLDDYYMDLKSHLTLGLELPQLFSIATVLEIFFFPLHLAFLGGGNFTCACMFRQVNHFTFEGDGGRDWLILKLEKMSCKQTQHKKNMYCMESIDLLFKPKKAKKIYLITKEDSTNVLAHYPVKSKRVGS